MGGGLGHPGGQSQHQEGDLNLDCPASIILLHKNKSMKQQEKHKPMLVYKLTVLQKAQ